MFVSVKNLKVEFPSKHDVVTAVNNISFELEKGEIFGLAGESGCGKTTTGLAFLGAIKKPGKVSGNIFVDGIDVTSLSGRSLRLFRWKKVSMIFQGAMNSLNPVKIIGSQILDVIQDHEDSTIKAATERVLKLLEEVGLDPLSTFHKFPHQLSGGQKQRVVIAMSLALDPEIIVADEPTTALDVLTQERILKLLVNIAINRNTTILLISHDINVLSKVCNRIAIMYLGKILEISTKDEIINHPTHPYTYSLLESYITIDKRDKIINAIPKYPDYSVINKDMCVFSPRCFNALEICKLKEPPISYTSKDHMIYCFNPIKRGE